MINFNIIPINQWNEEEKGSLMLLNIGLGVNMPSLALMGVDVQQIILVALGIGFAIELRL